MERPWSMATRSSLLWNLKANASTWVPFTNVIEPFLASTLEGNLADSLRRDYKHAKQKTTASEPKPTMPVLCSGGAVVFLILTVASNWHHESREQNERQREA